MTSFEPKVSTGVKTPRQRRAGTTKMIPGLVDSDDIRKWHAGHSLRAAIPVSEWKKFIPRVMTAKDNSAVIRKPVRARKSLLIVCNIAQSCRGKQAGFDSSF